MTFLMRKTIDLLRDLQEEKDSEVARTIPGSGRTVICFGISAHTADAIMIMDHAWAELNQNVIKKYERSTCLRRVSITSPNSADAHEFFV